MPRVLVTGMGVATAAGVGIHEFTTTLRRGTKATSGLKRAGGNEGGLDMTVSESLRSLERIPESLRREATRMAKRLPISLQASIVVGLQAWNDAELCARAVPPGRIAIVVAGNNLSSAYALETYRRYLEDDVVSPEYGVYSLDTSHIGVLSELLQVRGEGLLVGAASASGNLSIVHGERLLKWGVADVCLVVGALTEPSAVERRAWATLGAMDDSGNQCRPFDTMRAGFVPAQGAACVVLERSDSAEARGVFGKAEIAGVATCLDANRLPNPSIEGEATAMTSALKAAGLSPSHIHYINAHGTGSALGDEVELSAIHAVFGSALAEIWINSTKGVAGHCLSAAGVVEAVATIVQMQHGFVHGNPGLECPMRAGFRFVGRESVATTFDAALSNSFGFGGINSSIVLTREPWAGRPRA